MIELWFDGYCEPYPCGIGGIGLVIKQDDKDLHSISEHIGSGEGMSNNVAEYEALKRGLEYLKSNNLNKHDIKVYGDSKIVIMQMSGKWEIRNGIYKEKALETKELLKSFDNICFNWIPREQNTIADKLSFESVYAYNEHRRII